MTNKFLINYESISIIISLPSISIVIHIVIHIIPSLYTSEHIHIYTTILVYIRAFSQVYAYIHLCIYSIHLYTQLIYTCM